MATLKFSLFLLLLSTWSSLPCTLAADKFVPLVVNTWNFPRANQAAWRTIYHSKGSAIDAIEKGCNVCEDGECDDTVGFGGSPDENGETTLDAMLMDGTTMDVGGVGGLRNVKKAISVARHVLENTFHSLLVGNHATEFAMKLGFRNESLITRSSHNMWRDWTINNCQPNFWKNAAPSPRVSCGPYLPKRAFKSSEETVRLSENNHDTIGMIAIDAKGHIAAGTTTNGLKNKIPGRVGDSPIAGAGAYADQEVGAAAATGNGDIMMRFLPSFLAVELMRQGKSPAEAAEAAVQRISKYYPNFFGAVIALNKNGQFAAACSGMVQFPFYASNLQLGNSTFFSIPCTRK